MKLIVDVSEDIVDTLKCIETLSMEQEADLIDAVYEALDEEICEDAISRKDMALNIVSFYNKATGKKKTLDFLCKCVEGLPSVQPQQRWIPVSERFPDIGIDVLVCDMEGTIYLSHKSSYGSYFDEWGNKIKDIRAWMPLPEPYKASPTGAESEVSDADSD